MALIKTNDPSFMTAKDAATRRGFGARSELALRQAVEAFCRERWPSARIVHELVMSEGQVRADVVAIGEAHIAAFEIKGEYDDTNRLLHQVGMYQLCVPEVWMVVSETHAYDARLIRHLLPSVGLIVGRGWRDGSSHMNPQTDPEIEFLEVLEPAPRAVVPEMMLRLLWRSELASACRRSRCFAATDKTVRAKMVEALLGLTGDERQRLVCSELRGRDAMWRADAPLTREPGAEGPGSPPVFI